MSLEATGPARSVFEAALEAVVEFGHDSVCAEHILLGVLGLESGSASAALDVLGVDRTVARSGLEAMLPPRQSRERAGEYPYAPSGVAVVRCVWAQAARRKVETLTSALVLLGALEADGPELGPLRDAGVQVPALLAELRARASEPE